MSHQWDKVKREVFRKLLRPLVTFALRHGISYHTINDVLKELLVATAREEIRKTSPKVNVSRISAITGLHRKEVLRVENEEGNPEQQTNLLGKIMSQWRLDRRFSMRKGEPRALSLRGKDSEFAQLVGTVSKHLHPGTVLFELMRQGYAERTKNEVRLNRQIESVQGDPVKGIELVGRDIATLISAAEENILNRKETTNLHLRTEFDNITVKDMDVIRRWLMDNGKELHRRAREYLAGFDKDIYPSEEAVHGGGRVTITAFSYTEIPETAHVEQETPVPRSGNPRSAAKKVSRSGRTSR